MQPEDFDLVPDVTDNIALEVLGVFRAGLVRLGMSISKIIMCMHTSMKIPTNNPVP